MKIDPARLRTRIDDLALKRDQAADVALDVAKLELNRTRLRSNLIAEAMLTQQLSATAAETAARADESYLAAGLKVAERQADLARLQGACEKLDHEVDLGINLVAREEVQVA
jgi:hypothetical protein